MKIIRTLTLSVSALLKLKKALGDSLEKNTNVYMRLAFPFKN